jgi:hypothetical protein
VLRKNGTLSWRLLSRKTSLIWFAQCVHIHTTTSPTVSSLRILPGYWSCDLVPSFTLREPRCPLHTLETEPRLILFQWLHSVWGLTLHSQMNTVHTALRSGFCEANSMFSLFQDEKLRCSSDIPLSYSVGNAVTNSYSTLIQEVLISVDRFYIHCNLSSAFISASKKQLFQTLN